MAETCPDCEKAARKFAEETGWLNSAVYGYPAIHRLADAIHQLHLLGLSQGDARTLAAAIAAVREICETQAEIADHPDSGYLGKRGTADLLLDIPRMFQEGLQKQPASDALDAAKLEFGERVRESCEKKALFLAKFYFAQQEGKPAEDVQAEILSADSLRSVAKSIRALDLKALSTSGEGEK